MTAAARAMGRGALVTKARCMSVQYKAPVRDIKFVLDEVLDADRHYDKSGYEACDRDLRHSVIEECAKFAEDVLSPLKHRIMLVNELVKPVRRVDAPVATTQLQIAYQDP